MIEVSISSRYDAEFPFRPETDYIMLYSYEGQNYFAGSDSEPNFPLAFFESEEQPDPFQIIYEYEFHDVSELPDEARKEVDKGNSFHQLHFASRLKELYKNQHGTVRGIYGTIAENARVPADRGSGYVGAEQIKKLIRRNRTMTITQANAICGYLGCSVEDVRHVGNDSSAKNSARADATLSYIEKALRLYDHVNDDRVLERLNSAIDKVNYPLYWDDDSDPADRLEQARTAFFEIMHIVYGLKKATRY